MRLVPAALLACALLAGCAAEKTKTTPPDPDAVPMIAAALGQQQTVLLAALEADKRSATAVALASVPPTPQGFRPAWPGLRNLTIITGCGSDDQCVSPSLPAAADKQQRDEDAPDGDSPALDGQAGADSRLDVDKMTSPEERTDASAPPAKLRILPPVGR